MLESAIARADDYKDPNPIVVPRFPPMIAILGRNVFQLNSCSQYIMHSHFQLGVTHVVKLASPFTNKMNGCVTRLCYVADQF